MASTRRTWRTESGSAGPIEAVAAEVGGRAGEPGAIEVSGRLGTHGTGGSAMPPATDDGGGGIDGELGAALTLRTLGFASVCQGLRGSADAATSWRRSRS